MVATASHRVVVAAGSFEAGFVLPLLHWPLQLLHVDGKVYIEASRDFEELDAFMPNGADTKVPEIFLDTEDQRPNELCHSCNAAKADQTLFEQKKVLACPDCASGVSDDYPFAAVGF
jgi:hypothetical protein